MWKSLINMVLVEIDMRKLRAKNSTNIAAARWTLRQNPNSSSHWDAIPDTLCLLILSQWTKSKQRFHRFSIMSCHSSTKGDIMMILSKHKEDIITKTA